MRIAKKCAICGKAIESRKFNPSSYAQPIGPINEGLLKRYGVESVCGDCLKRMANKGA